MGVTTKISWTDITWNPARGCTKVFSTHPVTKEKVSACLYCYMKRQGSGIMKFDHEVVTQTSTKSGGAFYLPLRLPKVPAKVFLASLTDLWHKDVKPFRLDILVIMWRTPHLTYQIPTKRTNLILPALQDAHREACQLAETNGEMALVANWLGQWLKGNPPANIWLGVSVGYQHDADKWIPQLLKVPAVVHFVSAEPLLERISLQKFLPRLDWVIVGGESGNETGDYLYRPCALPWLHNLVDECEEAGVACWVKQLGTYLAKQLGIGTGQDRHATDSEKWPEPLRVQRHPTPVEYRQLTWEDQQAIKAWCGGQTWSRGPMRAVTGISFRNASGPVEVAFGDIVVKRADGSFAGLTLAQFEDFAAGSPGLDWPDTVPDEKA